MMKKEQPVQEPPPPRAIRLSFSIDGSTIQLVHEHRLEKTVFPSANLESQPRARFWYEVQDEAGIPLYRAFGRNPLDPWREVTTGDPERPLAFRKAERPEDFLTLVVPDLRGAHSLVLFGLAPSKPGAELDISKPPAEIARFPLAKVRGPGTSASDPSFPLKGKKGAYDGEK